MQALFDGQESGSEYDTYLQTAGWNDEKYRSRIQALGQGILGMAEKAPDLLGLEEIENIQVLEDLVKGPLAACGYRHLYFTHNPGASLGLGLISRFPLVETRLHSITDQGATIPRPVLEVRIIAQEQPLVLFVCHWKAKEGTKTQGGDTEFLRRASARVLSRRLYELRKEDPVLPVIIMGDLNENPDEWYRETGAVRTALLPDDPEAAARVGFPEDASWGSIVPDFLILSRQKPPQPVYFPAGAVGLYAPWGQELQGGSYYYQDRWESIDHFLLTESLFDHKGWEFDTCRVLNQAPFINAQGHPHTYNPRTGNGLSDHLPLVLHLRWTPPAVESLL
jgi:endonuclease/exonuclease/phosphatase family metal-dependent hydrolase